MSRQLIVFSNRRRMIAKLPREDRGDLFLALLDYNETGELPQGLSDIAQYAFDVIQEDVDNNAQYYAEVSEKRREAGRKGGIKSGQVRAKKNEANEANAYFACKNEANEAKHYTLNTKPEALNDCLEEENYTDSNSISKEYDVDLVNWMCNTATVNERRSERRSSDLFNGMPF